MMTRWIIPIAVASALVAAGGARAQAPTDLDIESARADMQAGIARYNQMMFNRLQAASVSAVQGKDAWWSACFKSAPCLEWLKPPAPVAAASPEK